MNRQFNPRQRPRRGYNGARHRRRTSPIETAYQCAVVALVIVGGSIWGVTTYRHYEARKAALAELPPGYEFSGCDEVRARGLAPLKLGEPGYSPRMDGDADGLACEPYP